MPKGCVVERYDDPKVASWSATSSCRCQHRALKMELITAGNPNIGALASVLHIVPIHYGKPLTDLLFIDAEGSSQDESSGPVCWSRHWGPSLFVPNSLQLRREGWACGARSTAHGGSGTVGEAPRCAA